MKRRLASVQRVLDVAPIKGADAIGRARIHDGPRVVTRGTFAPGALGVDLEIDAVTPDLPVWPFLRKPSRATPPQRARPAELLIRMMTLRGCLSQGLLMPLAELGFDAHEREGDDLSEVRAVKRYEPPMLAGADVLRAPFPSYVSRTDAMCVQSMPAALDESRGFLYVATLERDSTSATYFIDRNDKTFGACGCNGSIRDGENVYPQVARRSISKRRCVGGKAASRSTARSVGQGYKRTRLVSRAPRSSCAAPTTSMSTASSTTRRPGISVVRHISPPVAIVEDGEAFTHDVASPLARAEGFYVDSRNRREDIVIRLHTETFSQSPAGRLSFKAISNRYLLSEHD